MANQRISIKSLACSLGQTRCKALLFFHAFTGCDTTSAFKNIGKKKAYDALKCYPEAESLFEGFFSDPFKNVQVEDDGNFKILERFVVLMYSRTSLCHFVNDARLELYFGRSQNIENIPPTQNALLMHCKRAQYQCGIWVRSLDAQQQCPSPQNFGWKVSTGPDRKWMPIWTTMLEATKECREFVKCGCKAGSCSSTASCKCNAADFRCTLLCTCKCTDKTPYE